MSDNLKQKAATGIIWKFLDQGGKQLLQFISLIYIARILLPEDYGLIGLMTIFIGISMAFIDSGFRAALIQKGQNVTQDDYNTVFYFNIGVGMVFYLLIFWSAPYIAHFYDEPRLTLIARVLGLNLILSALGMIHLVIFEKRINFRTITKINFISILISIIIGIGMVEYNYGVWALVSLPLSENLIRTILLWIINKWRPNFRFSIKSFKDLYAVGSKLLFIGILTLVNQNFIPMVIGKIFTTADVGFFAQAQRFQGKITEFISTPIQGVTLSVQSIIKDDFTRLKNAVRTNVKITALFSFPAIIGFMVIGEPFIKIFLTDKWMPSLFYLQMISLAAIFLVLRTAATSYVFPIGKINFFVRMTVFSTFVFLAFLGAAVVFHLSLKLLVASTVIHEFIVLVVYFYYSRPLIGYKFREMFMDILPASAFSVIMGLIVYFLQFKFGISLIILVLQILTGASIYILLNYFFNRKMFNEILTFGMSLVRKT